MMTDDRARTDPHAAARAHLAKWREWRATPGPRLWEYDVLAYVEALEALVRTFASDEMFVYVFGWMCPACRAKALNEANIEHAPDCALIAARVLLGDDDD